MCGSAQTARDTARRRGSAGRGAVGFTAWPSGTSAHLSITDDGLAAALRFRRQKRADPMDGSRPLRWTSSGCHNASNGNALVTSRTSGNPRQTYDVVSEAQAEPTDAEITVA
jgi:hypothetical protein